MSGDEHLSQIRRRLRDYFEASARERPRWRAKNGYYHGELEKLISEIVPPGSNVVEAGCSTGDLLASLKPKNGLGLDFSGGALAIAKASHPRLRFTEADIENLSIDEKFDYVICADTIGAMGDVWAALSNLKKLCHKDTRLIITHYNYLWEPVLRLAEKLGLKARQPLHHWLTPADMKNLLEIAGFRITRFGTHILFPAKIPVLSAFINRYVEKLPLIKNLCLVYYFVARPEPEIVRTKEPSATVVVPVRNEAGNVRPLLERLPLLGEKTEVIFVDGDSDDGTVQILQDAVKTPRPGFSLRLIKQGGKSGKADAVHKGFAAASGEILIILDGDLSVAPEDLPKFYLALAEGKGEFINGSRMNYPMEKQAMRYLNNAANRFFGLAFTWLLGVSLRDTLCGTKALSRRNWLRIMEANRFGDFDPFGDFELLFGAAQLGLEIREMPVRYRSRSYGETKISRFSHGLTLLKMCAVALRRLKFRP